MSFASKTTLDDQPVTLKLTFVFVAMVHSKVYNTIRDKKWYDEKSTHSIRCTQKSCPKLPKNVELIVLRERGLIDLLGYEAYEHLKFFKPPVLLPSSKSKEAKVRG